MYLIQIFYSNVSFEKSRYEVGFKLICFTRGKTRGHISNIPSTLRSAFEKMNDKNPFRSFSPFLHVDNETKVCSIYAKIGRGHLLLVIENLVIIETKSLRM